MLIIFRICRQSISKCLTWFAIQPWIDSLLEWMLWKLIVLIHRLVVFEEHVWLGAGLMEESSLLLSNEWWQFPCLAVLAICISWMCFWNIANRDHVFSLLIWPIVAWISTEAGFPIFLISFESIKWIWLSVSFLSIFKQFLPRWNVIMVFAGSLTLSSIQTKQFVYEILIFLLLLGWLTHHIWIRIHGLRSLVSRWWMRNVVLWCCYFIKVVIYLFLVLLWLLLHGISWLLGFLFWWLPSLHLLSWCLIDFVCDFRCFGLCTFIFIYQTDIISHRLHRFLLDGLQ